MARSPAPTKGPSPRQQAARIVLRWLQASVRPEPLVDRVTESRAFVTELVYGTIRRWRSLAWWLDRAVPKPAPPPVEACLLCGLYELAWMDTRAPHAVVSEAVSAARALTDRRAAGLVNAVLRRFLREEDAWRRALAEAPLAIRESHPDFLADRWRERLGSESAEALCQWDNRPPRTWLRRVADRASAEDFARILEPAVDARVEVWGGEWHRLAPGQAPDGIPGFRDGLITVADPATGLAVDLMALRAGETVLDACAAPGGKTMQILERVGDSGRVLACDVSEARLKPVRETARRLGRRQLSLVAADMTEPGGPASTFAPRGFDAVLVDAPCTNSGVLRRRPDARWRFDADRLAGAVACQRTLLDAAAGRVRPGGRLVYSTCSLEPEENAEQVRAFLGRHPEFALDAETLILPPTAPDQDGVYAARLIRAREGA